MVEQRLLAAMLQERSAYELFERIGTGTDSFSPLGKRLFSLVDFYYRVDPSAGSCSRDCIRDRALGAIENPKHIPAIEQYIGSIPRDISVANVEHDIREFRRVQAGGKLSVALANGSTEDEIQALWEERQAGSTVRRDDSTGTASLVDILATDDLTSDTAEPPDFIKLWPKSLNDQLDGGALRGHHVLLFARPENGKTLVAINLCAGFLHQKLRVAYVGNEEPAADVRDRIRGRLLGISKTQVRTDPTEAARRLALADLGKLVIASDASTFTAIRRLLSGPSGPFDVLVVDQLRNMRITADSKNAQLEIAATEARAIGKDANVLVISVTQAGDSATNKVFLEMNDVDNSKTGIPGAVDLMIGVGSDDTMKLNGLLGFSLCKNKMSGLHTRFTVPCDYLTGVLK